MNNTFSLQQISRTSNLDANLKSRQYELNLMADFMRVKYENPKLNQSQLANQLGDSTSNLQRYRNDINMLSPYRIQPNNTKKRAKNVKNTNFDNNSHRDHDLERTQMASNDLKRPQSSSNGKKVKTKNNLKGGFVHENVEINDQYLDDTLDNNDILMDSATQLISSDKTLRIDTIEDLKEFNSQSLSTRAKKGEQLVSLMPAIKKAFNLMGDDIVELHTENESLKNKIGSYDEKWLEESKEKLLKQIDYEKRANLIMSRREKQMNKQLN